MRRLVAVVLSAGLLLPLGTGARAATVIVDDGDFFYTLNPQACTADTDNPAGAQARRHWHVGIPFAPAEAEVAGGFGCLGGPKTYLIRVLDGGGTVQGRIRYTWDTNVPGGCCNDVQLHAFDASGALVDSTLFADGPMPVVPMVLQVREHRVAFELAAGQYRLVEDIFSGEHTAWLTRLTCDNCEVVAR